MRVSDSPECLWPQSWHDIGLEEITALEGPRFPFGFVNVIAMKARAVEDHQSK
jgi:hypothetical protein